MNAVQAEGDAGQRLAESVVHVPSDAHPFFIGTDRPQPREPTRIVDGKGGRL
jgi:hypothetical protein